MKTRGSEHPEHRNSVFFLKGFQRLYNFLFKEEAAALLHSAALCDFWVRLVFWSAAKS
jgi:hypothetical protein